jgi:MarR family transcriptional regulator, organic hydroperoxide resistance regulator
MRRNEAFATLSRARAAVNEFLAASLSEQGIEGLAPSHGDILAVLFHSGELGMTELATRIRRSKNTVTVLVGKLEEQGYVSRVSDPEDARRSLVSLTAKGSALREPFERISRSLVARGLRGVDEADLEAMGRCLERILENLGQ